LYNYKIILKAVVYPPLLSQIVTSEARKYTIKILAKYIKVKMEILIKQQLQSIEPIHKIYRKFFFYFIN